MTYDKNELQNKHPSDIAETIAALSDSEQTVAFILLPGHISGEVFMDIN
jgi:Mg/Co/Ni transporter MgtE